MPSPLMSFRRLDGMNRSWHGGPSSAAKDDEVKWLREQLQESSGQLGRVRLELGRVQLELATLKRSVITTVGAATTHRDDAKTPLHLPSAAADPAAVDPLARPDKATKKRIIATISRCAPFEGSDEATLGRVADSMVPASFGASTDVLCEGDDGDLAYWVSSGSLEVLVGGKVRATRATRAGERSRLSLRAIPLRCTSSHGTAPHVSPPPSSSPFRIFSHCTTAPAAPRPTAPHPSRLAPPFPLAPPLAPLPSIPPSLPFCRESTPSKRMPSSAKRRSSTTSSAMRPCAPLLATDCYVCL
jgi:hypothetical protein